MDTDLVNLKSQVSITYDPTHDVLVFPSFESIKSLHQSITSAQDNYIYDKGNSEALLDKLNLILTNGYTNGNGNGNGNSSKVNINALQSQMLSSYPLSDEVLQKTLDINNQISSGLPHTFLRDILISNVPFSRQIREAIVASAIPPGIKNQILNVDDNTLLTKNHVYEEFLNQFPTFNSLWETRQEIERANLAAGMNPSDDDFNVDFLPIEFDQLIFNDKHELYVEGYLYKIYSDCKMATFYGTIEHCYEELLMLDEGGFVTPPQSVEEPTAGLALNVMAMDFPLEYALVNPGNYSPEYNNLENYNSQDQDNCPQAEFSYFAYYNETNHLEVYFDNFTALSYVGTDYYQYWTFGDGTGSFQENPTHIYATDGVYTVKLYTFKDDCGCWDVQTQTVQINNSGKPPVGGSCDTYFQYFPDQGNPLYYVFTVETAFTYVSPASPISVVTWDFGDGSSIEYGLTVNHTFDSGDDFEVTCTVEFAPVPPETQGCIATKTSKIQVSGSSSCCDRKDQEKTKDIILFGGGYQAKTKDQLCGYTFYGLIGGRVKTQLIFYKEKSGGGWKREKADKLAVWYEVNVLLLEEGECSIPQTISNSKEKLNESGVLKWHDASNDPFGVEAEGAEFRHQVIYNGVTSPELVTFLGECK